MISRQNRSRFRKEDGFSLSELLIVIFIIGIVAAISVPSFTLQRKNSVDQQVKSDITAANNIIESWIIRHPSQRIPSGGLTKVGGVVTPNGGLVNSGLQGFKLSDGTTLKITGNTSPLGTFTIVGTNDRGNVANKAGGLIYDSTKGNF